MHGSTYTGREEAAVQGDGQEQSGGCGGATQGGECGGRDGRISANAASRTTGHGCIGSSWQHKRLSAQPPTDTRCAASAEHVGGRGQRQRSRVAVAPEDRGVGVPLFPFPVLGAQQLSLVADAHLCADGFDAGAARDTAAGGFPAADTRTAGGGQGEQRRRVPRESGVSGRLLEHCHGGH
eukprot:ctg_2058.g521